MFEWEDVDYADHPIRPSYVEERCWYCNSLATHKIQDADSGGFHPLTDYTCCYHFFGRCEINDY